ncbi:PTS alpha-glucoside transporter subunit IIA [Streptomonospora sp. PA3]|uniref:PTS transporter subunit EIIC n=1 Tax=Streptomonospora sp. PA3 TaxID=2607326 RepID=UPI0012DDF205|nr:PTS transporter subunit EIIC [Streptomonospora sp. PA3]MUL41978.1 PTS alpha-glucoside transporter subunit IIA [Streptomonospora sp. PA3]
MSDSGATGHAATAHDLLALVGGERNVTSVTNCISRLRVGVADRALVRDQEIRDHPKVLGVVEDETFQIVLGPAAVSKIAEEFTRLVDTERAAAGGAGSGAGEGPASAPGGADTDAAALAAKGAAIRAENKRRNATPFKLFLRRIANIFVPLIPALIACGILAGVTGVFANLGWLGPVLPALDAIAKGFMSLITVFVGVNAAKEFGGTPVLGGAVAAIIPFAGVADVQAFGVELAPGQGGVLGALGAAVLCAYVERWTRRWVPGTLDILVTPTVAVLVSGLVTVYGLMFLAGEVSAAIGVAADWLLGQAGALAGLILGGLFLPLVMLGLHQALIPIHTTLIDIDGYTVLLPVLAMAGAGQVGAAFALYLRLKNNEGIRTTIRSALPAGLLGVGEPLIYGVTLPLGRPFLTACAGGAVGGGFLGLANQLGVSAGSTAIGPSGWALFPLVQGNQGIGAAVLVYGLGLVVGYIAGFVLTYFFGLSRQAAAELNATETIAPDSPPDDDAAAAPEPAGDLAETRGAPGR